MKCYGDVTAVDDWSLRVAPGEIYAFLGLKSGEAIRPVLIVRLGSRWCCLDNHAIAPRFLRRVHRFVGALN